MIDAFKSGFVVILLVLALIVYPTIRLSDKNDDQSFRYANSAVEQFVDTVTSQGFISPKNYIELQQKLAATGAGYAITLEHHKKVQNPVYNGTTFQNRFTVDFEGYFNKDILDKMFPTGSSEADDSPVRRWNMHEGDLFVARIVTNTESVTNNLKGILGFRKSIPIPIEYGGAVRHEAP